MDTQKTSQIVKQWYNSVGNGDMEAVINGLSERIEFELPQDEYNKIIPYLGKKLGREQVAEAFKIRAETTKVKDYELRDFVVQGNKACVVVYTNAIHQSSEKGFEIEDLHHLTLDEDGKIAKWKVYFDPNAEVAAFRADIDSELIKAVQENKLDAVQKLLEFGANVNARDAKTGLTILMIAAGQANAEMEKILLDAGADVFAVDSKAGASALHKACQGGSVEVARLLVEAGAFVDWVAPTTGHTPLMDALWFKWPAIVEYLLEVGAGLNLSTHYGFSLVEHFEYELNVNTIGKDKLLQAEKALKKRQKSDQQKVQNQKLMAAVNTNDIATVKHLIQSGVDIDEKYPILNHFNDAHTPLLVAARDGHTEIVVELLKARADVNVTEPTFGAVPLHKAVYNGHADITKILVDQPGIDIDFQGATNGYTPLHDALWHGYAECAEILINAGARLDLKGHDGKTPLAIASGVFDQEHAIIKLIQSKLETA
ncbi:ankyrin repeat domain-containing protein (plasmid) [Nostoc edaphicum CCNP1411]|uniref:Ankyrin repeat domain-containing protein n=1 Tax=Nostoc edaphicum CCNP1411 TaxID=1472755 RepID=A0A7D7L826_9NOSO|nr:ankyrin repeat domain-containing protein [Nostoc edaphicum]QMS86173.1 ankyrin repeat domain-containing protein [Nostoc edaphicum CCNP1411]